MDKWACNHPSNSSSKILRIAHPREDLRVQIEKVLIKFRRLMLIERLLLLEDRGDDYNNI